MNGLAPHYRDDFWFLSYHAMALSEDGQLSAARAKIEQSLAANLNKRTGRMALLMSVRRAASWRWPAVSYPGGWPLIRVTVFSMGI
jgi:hypothetical protein